MKERNLKEEASTKERLLNNGIELFSQNGYDGTTTRMIAEKCQVNVATMAFHYGSKEGFYISVMNHAAEIMEEYFRPFGTKVEQYLSGQPYAEKTWALIDEFFDLIINVVRDQHRHATLYLLIREQTNPPAGDYPLTRIVYKNSEAMVMNLICALRPDLNTNRVAVHTRLIIGGIISQAEHPLFLRRALHLDDDAELKDRVWAEVKRFSLSCVQRLVESKE